ncbi:hypothetical protein [Jiangella asiatica]|uniref:Uncharacterized protein n=1 Tax=Jiangella asiatica TaxID=2530372 RepID=A0A4R5D8A1_9ACTN|nr:hypothetical protein [Jiangella asiatica]TDE09686.1 hypothetical protein E1269_13740 [Jiangella asiatica]
MENRLAQIVDETPHQAPHVLLAVALGVLEGSTSRNTWRQPDNTARRYFIQLAAWGYTLSDVEQQVATASDDAVADGGIGDATEPSAEEQPPTTDHAISLVDEN